MGQSEIYGDDKNERIRTHTKRSDMDGTALPANYTMSAFCFASVHQMPPPLSEVQGIGWELITDAS